MLQVNEVNFSLTGLTILNGISFSVRHGETVGIIGPNGSGKTTLFNCISGFHIPQQGRIVLNSEDITKWPPYERARAGLARVFQNPGIFREMSVVENILMALEGCQSTLRTILPWGRGTAEKTKVALEHLAQVGLAARAKEKAASLSGGQMRLLEITRALVFGAELFLLDEPTAGVSPKMKDEVADLIRRVQAQGKTVLVIEHDLNFIEKFCNRIIVLDIGRVVLDGTPTEVRQSPVLKQIYFGE